MTKDGNIYSDAVATLRNGGVILYPTDTVWGLGCDATNEEAVRKIYDIKKRPDSKSLVLLASDLDMVARYIREIPEMAIQLVEVNDRPMTIIYPDAITGAEYRGLAYARIFGMYQFIQLGGRGMIGTLKRLHDYSLLRGISLFFHFNAP